MLGLAGPFATGRADRTAFPDGAPSLEPRKHAGTADRGDPPRQPGIPGDSPARPSESYTDSTVHI